MGSKVKSPTVKFHCKTPFSVHAFSIFYAKQFTLQTYVHCPHLYPSVIENEGYMVEKRNNVNNIRKIFMFRNNWKMWEDTK